MVQDSDGHHGSEWSQRLALDRSRRAAGTEPGRYADLAAHARVTAGSYYHPVGTCAIGAVVDERGVVHGIDGLQVADASIIPRSTHASTHLTVLAVAERMAELIG